jgi:methionine synthase I (cobalamin-dependent)
MLLTGEISAEILKEVFREQAQALADAGADAIVVETMSDLEEAKAALAAVKTVGLPAVVCLVFDAGREKDRTMMGATPEQVARELTDAGADVIGANCGVGIERYVPVCRRLRTATSRPIWIKANAGLPRMEGTRAVYDTTATEFASYVPALLSAGASFIGGCCGTTPDFIRAVRQKLG